MFVSLSSFSTCPSTASAVSPWLVGAGYFHVTPPLPSASPADGRKIPTELRREEAQLRDSMAFDDVEHEGQGNTIVINCSTMHYRRVRRESFPSPPLLPLTSPSPPMAPPLSHFPSHVLIPVPLLPAPPLPSPPLPSPAPALDVSSHMDDEYAWAGVEDPKVVITTSHNPSSRLKQFSKVGSW